MKISYFIILSFINITLTAMELKTNDGKVYKDVTILGKNLTHLEIMHISGVAKIPFSIYLKKIKNNLNILKKKQRL